MKKTLITALTLVLPLLAFSSHLRCGYISVQRVSSTNLTCKITVTAFTSSSSGIAFGGGTLVLGNESFITIPAEIPATPRPDLGPNIGMASYSIEHTYTGPGRYKVSYTEQSRNGGIINLTNSLTTPFYIETTFNLDPFLGVFDTPEFLVDPFFTAKLGNNLSLSVGAFSPEDHIITYELGVPNGGQILSNYRLPENFQINPHNGLIIWDTRFLNQYIAGEYLFTVKIHLSKKIDGNLYRLCTVNRDFQIILTDDEPDGRIFTNITLDENNRIYIPENETRTIKIFYEPNLADNTTLMAYTELSNQSDAFSFSTYDSTQADIKVGVLTLTAKSEVIRNNPYIITVRGNYLNDGSSLFAHDICFMFYTLDVFPEIITSTEDELSQLETSPNPVTDFLNIRFASPQPVRIILINPSGQVILKKELSESDRIDMRGLSRGIYFCEIRTGSLRRVVRIVKH
ncbi:MAG: T9SS type A sorting domain-containing protein [Cyclobacteriaceae bacterium]|nr:T9SS type A sorting domain-containing protein [Cyclobacteriaceae bacterium]